MDVSASIPSPPAMSEWAFVNELACVEPVQVNWDWNAAPGDIADLSCGIRIFPSFPDPEGVLQTAYGDFAQFCRDVDLGEGAYTIVTGKAETPCFEAYRIRVMPEKCMIEAADTEGIRRGLYFLRDELCRAQGPHLVLGTVERRPHVHTRISRCCYGPKNRPGNYATKPGMPGSLEEVFGTPDYDRWKDEPEMRDELFDDREYFPDAYLSRLAAESVNGLWVAGMFWQLCRTAAFPSFGPQRERRMEHLRRIVKRCARYGIKIFLFCIEPRSAGDPNTLVEIPESIRGHQNRMYCTSTLLGQQGLDECVRSLFTECPNLGGLINLCVGERGTHCYSGWLEHPNTCPRCKDRDPFDVLNETLTIMYRAMHETAPQARLIAWPYSQYLTWGIDMTREYAAHVPEGITLMHNFESAGECEQLGKPRTLTDYWLSWPGPSQLFRDCAVSAHDVGAKIQTACSYEMATVPFVPVPGNLWRKYRTIRELGVGTVMQCWLIGSFPSPMTKAVGELSFEPFPETETEFFCHLASIDWPGCQDRVAEAWEWFGEAYRNYPYSRLFSYYSPMNNGPVWPLHLLSRDIGLQAPFRAGRPPSGDRIGECLGDDFTLDEALCLCDRMREGWERGMALLDPLRTVYATNTPRLRDIAVCEAAGLLIQSTCNILRFYQRRENLAWDMDADARLNTLNLMRDIVEDEMRVSKRLQQLAEADTRLGFQADSECHVYYPEKLQWRVNVLRKLEKDEFTPVEHLLRSGADPFASYTARKPTGAVMRCTRITEDIAIDGRVTGRTWMLCDPVSVDACAPPDSATAATYTTTMRTFWNDTALYIGIVCAEPRMDALHMSSADTEPVSAALNDCVQISIEPQRLWPVRRIFVTASGARYHYTAESDPDYDWEAASFHGEDFWSLTVRLPWQWILHDTLSPEHSIRMLVQRHIPSALKQAETSGPLCLSWPCIPRPLPPRLMLFTENPADLGWCLMEIK